MRMNSCEKCCMSAGCPQSKALHAYDSIPLYNEPYLLLSSLHLVTAIRRRKEHATDMAALAAVLCCGPHAVLVLRGSLSIAVVSVGAHTSRSSADHPNPPKRLEESVRVGSSDVRGFMQVHSLL